MSLAKDHVFKSIKKILGITFLEHVSKSVIYYDLSACSVNRSSSFEDSLTRLYLCFYFLQVLDFWSFMMIYKLVGTRMFRSCGKCLEKPSQKWHLGTINASADHCGGYLYGPVIVLTHPSPQNMLINRQLAASSRSIKSVWRIKTCMATSISWAPLGGGISWYGTKLLCMSISA